jgi:hypothetical protein
MRLIALGILAALAATTPAHAAWKEYVFKDVEVAKDFPSEPKKEKGVYKTPLAKEAPSVTYSVTQEGITYQMTIVDFTKRAGDGANLLNEAAQARIGEKGVKFSLDDFPLYDKGTASVYGTLVTIDKPNGDRAKAALFFNKGRLYVVEAIVPSSADKGDPGVTRFMDTVRFHMAGYGFDYASGHDFPIGDDTPGNRDVKVIPGYKLPEGYVPPPGTPPLTSKPGS